jgi:hypothetical protein
VSEDLREAKRSLSIPQVAGMLLMDFGIIKMVLARPYLSRQLSINQSRQKQDSINAV